MTLHIGECSIDKVIEQTSSLPFAALFPAHRETMGDTLAQQPAELSIHSWVVRTARDTIVIDTATGNGRNRDNKPLFHQLQTAWPQRLAEAGVDPDEVTLVLMTHIHTDHVGWNTCWRAGRWQPMFRHARYICSARELAQCRSTPSMQTLYHDSLAPLLASGQLETIDVQRSPLFAGVLRYMPTPGHSVDHASIVLQSAGAHAVFSGDVMHHPVQFAHPQWNSVFCEDLPRAVTSRQLLIDWCISHQALWCSSHFAGSSCGRVSPERQWIPVEA